MKMQFLMRFLLASVTNFFDTSSGHSDSKIMDVCVLHIHLVVLLLQKHSFGNSVCNSVVATL